MDTARLSSPATAGKALLTWFERYGRTHLPWRIDPAPYRVVVSEFMLQQTQVERVIPLFEAFMLRYPSFQALAAASKADILRLWQGLGYNSRAVRLLDLAKRVCGEFDGKLPSDTETLADLPGIGPYTRAAIRAFAFDLSDVALDVNVRRIVHRVFYGIEYPPLATVREIDATAREMLVEGESRAWNSAMMDLGSSLCTARAPKCMLCPLRSHCAAAPVDPQELRARAAQFAPRKGPQSSMRFEDTVRFVRGKVIDRLRLLVDAERISLLDLHADLAPVLGTRAPGEVAEIVSALERDGLVGIDEHGIRLAE